MKTSWILFLLLFSANGFSQDTLAKVTIHTWAGGQCCSSGTDISIVISSELIRSDYDSVVYISSNGQIALLYPNDFKSINGTQKNSCTLTYGWSSMRYGNDAYSGTTSYYGLPVSRFRTGEMRAIPKLVFYFGKQMVKEGKVNEQFTMTAYP